MNIQVKIADGTERLLTADTPSSLLSLLRQNGIFPESICGGNGLCGKCRVILAGECTSLTNAERQLLSPDEQARGIRLACETTVLDDCTVTLLEQQTPFGSSEGVQGSGLAVDIGTTTVELAWYDTDGKCRGTERFLNPQIPFGADVMARVQYAMQNKGTELTNKIRRALSDAIGDQTPMRCAITGNTAMLHLLTGLDVTGLGKMPFAPVSLFGYDYDTAFLMPCISAYVGADITSAIYASGMLHEASALLLDIGTNGEMAYWNGETLTCCATAAGPAFEGAGLSCGMTAQDGAICSVRTENGQLQYQTVGGQPPRGICGSGIVDVIACLLQTGILSPSGYLEKPVEIGDSGIAVTPADIRQIQLAKAAIAAGIKTLCPDLSDVGTFYLAGRFGRYLRLQNAAAIGLLPQKIVNRTVVLGNAALTGAGMVVTAHEPQKAKDELCRIAALAKTTDLSQNPAFQDAYINEMMFSHQEEA